MKVRHDIHAHTHLSLCAKESATVEFYVQSALEKGVKLMGIADHMWSKDIPFPDAIYHSQGAGQSGQGVVNFYAPQTVERCLTVREELARIDTKGVKFLVGGEVEYAQGYGLAITEREAEQLDFIIVPNSHTHMMMDASLYEPYRKHGEFMLRATMEMLNSPMSKYITSLAHPFCAVCCPYPKDCVLDTIRDEELEEVFLAAKEKDIGVEINGSYYTKLQPEEIRNMGMYHVLDVAKKCGCLFTFGTDCHSDQRHGDVLGVEKVANLLGLTDEDLHPLVRPYQQ